MAIYDLSHTIGNETITYRGFPAPIICDFISREQSKIYYEKGTTFQIARMDFVTNSGTYLDSPFHRYEDGKDLSDLALERLVHLPAICLRIHHSKKLNIEVSDLEKLEISGKAILLHTGWDEHWMTDNYFADHPYLTRSAAQYLVDKGAILVGIDSHNIDDTRSNDRPVHSILLHHDIYIVEHLCGLDAVPDEVSLFFTAVPPKIKKVGTFPVRAFVETE